MIGIKMIEWSIEWLKFRQLASTGICTAIKNQIRVMTLLLSPNDSLAMLYIVYIAKSDIVSGIKNFIQLLQHLVNWMVSTTQFVAYRILEVYIYLLADRNIVFELKIISHIFKWYLFEKQM